MGTVVTLVHAQELAQSLLFVLVLVCILNLRSIVLLVMLLVLLYMSFTVTHICLYFL
jgi:hypothetical protein